MEGLNVGTAVFACILLEIIPTIEIVYMCIFLLISKHVVLRRFNTP